MNFQAEGNGDTVSARLPGEERAVMNHIDHRQRTVQFSGVEDVVAPWRKVLTAHSMLH